MPQTSRTNGGLAKPAAYWETIRDRIDQGIAVKVFNGYIRGEHDDKERAAMAWRVVDKFCPSLQALAISIEDSRPASINDLQARAAMLGLDTTAILGDPNAILPDSNTDSKGEDKTPLEVECVQGDSADSDTQAVPGESETGQDDTSD